MKYTKGEWKAYQIDAKPDRWMVCAGKEGERGIAQTVLDNSIPPAEKKANANLIAKSPRMYELLKQLADWDAGKFGKESNIKIIEISKQASQLIETLKEDYNGI